MSHSDVTYNGINGIKLIPTTDGPHFVNMPSFLNNLPDLLTAVWMMADGIINDAFRYIQYSMNTRMSA